MPFRFTDITIVFLAACLAIWLAFPPVSQAQSTSGDVASDGERSAVILMYHRFGEDRYPTTNIRIEQFKAHIKELRRDRYNVWPLPKIIETLKAGKKLPPRTIAITIDDAFLSVYDEAFPRLEDADLPFTLFVSTGSIARNSKTYMSWDQIEDMMDSDLVTIGNHLVSHTSALKLSHQDVRAEINRAQAKIREELGITPTLFSYPYGEYSNAVIDIIAETGFAAAFGQQSGAMSDKMNFLALPRYALNEYYSDIDRFRLVVNSLPLPIQDLTPDETYLNQETNPPLYGFTVDQRLKYLDGLKCYASSGGELSLERLGKRRFEIRLEKAFPSGRSRINCTVADISGRWRWHGTQFVVP